MPRSTAALPRTFDVQRPAPMRSVVDTVCAQMVRDDVRTEPLPSSPHLGLPAYTLRRERFLSNPGQGRTPTPTTSGSSGEGTAGAPDFRRTEPLDVERHRWLPQDVDTRVHPCDTRHLSNAPRASVPGWVESEHAALVQDDGRRLILVLSPRPRWLWSSPFPRPRTFLPARGP
ncbi:hypothetical protein BC628DRAFT_237191 [Trametes gibbosa]|nr:hypothetical protein BC628DRAFT_237191 [Trametes gibbosa]